tara:strand:+ start:798 stop:1673 length:876 start_codon:yes stop_codon:yes gene_type:complete
MLKIDKVKTDWKGELPDGLTWYFIGQPKSGKTTAAANWHKEGSEKVLVIDTDLGADFVDGANVVTCAAINPPMMEETKDGVKITDKNGKPKFKIIPPEDRGFYYRSGDKKGQKMPVYSLAEILSDLMKHWDKYDFDTIVLDTLDQVNSWIEDIVKHDLQINEMGEGNWGADWAAARKKNVNIVRRLQDFLKKVGGNLILTSHAKSTVITDDKVQLAPNLPSGLGRAVCAKADVIGYTTIGKDDQSYMISFKGYDERMVGSRLKPLAQKVLPFDYNSVIKAIKSYKEEEGDE